MYKVRRDPRLMSIHIYTCGATYFWFESWM